MSKSKKSISNRILLTLAAIIIIVWFYPHRNINQFVYEEGRPWNYAQLIAPFDIPIHADSTAIRAARDTLALRFVPIYTIDNSVVDSIATVLSAADTPQGRHLASLVRVAYAKGVVSADDMEKIKSGKLPKIRILSENILSEESTSAFTTPRMLYGKLDSIIGDGPLHDAFIDADLPGLIQPNIIYNEVESKRHYNNDYATLTADRGVILQGQAIINKGAIITAQDFTNLRTYEQLLEQRAGLDSRSTLLNWLGQFLYVSILMSLLLIYCTMVEPKQFAHIKTMLFLLSSITTFFLISVALGTFIPGGAYLVPITIVPILVLVFFDSRTAFYTAVLIVLLIAPITAFPLEYIFLELCACTFSIFTLKELALRSQLLRTAGICAGAYIIGYFALELLLNGSLNGWSWRMTIFLLVNSLLVSMAYILMFAVEKLFGFVSIVTLVELTDSNQPLLRELTDIAPATYQHCVAVGTLAADAARAVGANVQLVRAGALYHDIGKMTRPEYFTENQHGFNPHDADDMTPLHSAQIIVEHVTEGIRLANKNGLPEVIKDFIREHHGAHYPKYFVDKAIRQGLNVDLNDFSYPGPNPRTRESSIIMMADSVEAASHSLTQHSPEAITNLVDKIIDGQIADGLHNNSTLEFADVARIKDAFIKRLQSIYHTRIAYPEKNNLKP